MTFLENALEYEYANNSTEVSVYEIMKNSCPSEYGLSEDTKCEERGESTEHDCVKCWNREMPGTESKDETSCDDVKAAYDQGLEDASDALIALVNLSAEELEIVFECSSFEFIIENVSMKNIIAKLKAYEESQEIKAGDVFIDTNIGKPCVLSSIVNDVDNPYIVTYGDGSGGSRSKWVFLRDYKKTGKHIDIQSILAQIGE